MSAREPWRYRCPECRSVRLKRREKRGQAKEVVQDKRFATPNWTSNPFYCKSCNTATERVYDAKRDRDVPPGAVDKASVSRWKTSGEKA